MRNRRSCRRVAHGLWSLYLATTMTDLDRRISVAPMMDWTDRHCRYFLRGFSPRVLLYTEMIVAAAIVRGSDESLQPERAGRRERLATDQHGSLGIKRHVEISGQGFGETNESYL